MTLAVDFPECSRSFLGRLDARWKLAALGLATLLTALQRTLLPCLGSLLLSLILVRLGQLPAGWYSRRIATVCLFLALFVAWAPLVVPGDGWDLGPVHVSLAGCTLALVVLVKACAIVSFMLVLWATAPLQDTFKAAHALHVPGLVVQLVVLTYRYIFLLAEELRRLRIALRVRGYRHRANLHSYRTVGHVTGALLIHGYERAERVGQAMRCRGFDGTFRSLTGFRTRAMDAIVFLVILTCAAGLLLWDRLA